jgi:lysophospholipase L1-like esterase
MKPAMRILILLSVLYSCLLLAADYPDPSRWDYTIGGFALEDEIVQFEKGDIVATGSSSVRFWRHRIRDDLSPLTIIPRGFGGSNMNDVLHHMETLVLKHEPRAVILYEGDNDVAQNVSTEKIMQTFQAFISMVHKPLPETRIYIIAVKPSISRASMWPAMVEVNSRLKRLCNSDERLIYIDVATPMLNKDGSIREDLFVTDQLHMNQKGYDIWRDTIAPVLIAGES